MKHRETFLIEASLNGRKWFATNCSGKLKEYDRRQDAEAALTKLRKKTELGGGPPTEHRIYPIYY
jgi:hypothetical protein